ncbi:hypothetical protein ACOSQ3_033566 [Xanthoceras sorbifolium]
MESGVEDEGRLLFSEREKCIHGVLFFSMLVGECLKIFETGIESRGKVSVLFAFFVIPYNLDAIGRIFRLDVILAFISSLHIHPGLVIVISCGLFCFLYVAVLQMILSFTIK